MLDEDPDTTSYDEFKQKFRNAMEETTQLEIRKYYAADNAAMENLTGSITQLENCLGLRDGLGLRDAPECYMQSKGLDYRGQKAVTKSGRECQHWNTNSPHKPAHKPAGENAENYCRNPSKAQEPWCYTTDENKRWEYCGIPKCSGAPEGRTKEKRQSINQDPGRTKEKRQSINQDPDSPYSEFKEKIRETLGEIIQLEIRKKDAVRDDAEIMKKLNDALVYIRLDLTFDRFRTSIASGFRPHQGEIRLVRKGEVVSNSIGRLEIYHRGEWGTVCDDGLWGSTIWGGANGQNLAKVVCRIKGFADGKLMTKPGFEAGTGRIWLNNVACIGNEISLCDCPHKGWGATKRCNHYEDVGITCV